MKFKLVRECGLDGGGAGSILRAICFAAGVWLCAVPGAAGQGGSAADITPVADLGVQLQDRLAEARTGLAREEAAQAGTAGLPPGATATEAEERHLLAQALVRAYQEHLDQAARLKEVRRRLEDFGRKSKAWTGFAESAPYSILLVDGLRDSVQSLAAKVAVGEASQKLLASFTLDAEAGLKSSDERLRLLAERLETAADDARTTRLIWQRSMEQLRNRCISARLAMNEVRCQRVEAEQAEDCQQLAFARRQLAVVAPHVRFSREDLEKVLASLASDLRGIEREQAEAEKEHEARQRELADARGELRQILEKPLADALPATRSAEVARLQAKIELASVRTETGAQKLAVLRMLADLTVNARGLWQMRLDAFRSKELDELRGGYQRLDQLTRVIRSVKPHFLRQIEVAAAALADQRNRERGLDGAAADPDPAAAQALADSYRQRGELASRALCGLEQAERLTQRWKESLDEDRRHLPVAARVRDLFGSFSTFTAKLWNFEIFVAEDTIMVDGQSVTGRRSITVGKVVMAVLILAVGYWLSLLLSRMLERMAVRRLKVEPAQASLIRRWVRVVLIAGLVVFSLVSVKIPLTVFAFLGGALAIGLGFGTQNLLKNFVSGIIILFERPFRVGDVLDIGGSRGTVVGIGIRSSVVRMFDNTETLIPNSALLENNLTNWTYSDRKVRFTLSIGVAYGSDTRRVGQLLAEVAEHHGLVQKDPVPQVFFLEFGDNTLTFELRYWVDVVKHNAAQIGSDLCHMIVGVFAEHNISINSPQHDIRLDTARPLQMQIVRQTPPPQHPETT